MNQQFKSMLFKTKYYSISYKLNFILKSSLFKVDNKEYNLSYDITKLKCYDNFIHSSKCKLILYDKFIFRDMIIIYDNQVLFYQYNKLHRDKGPAVIITRDNSIIFCQYYKNGVRARKFE